ncbi:MULTISPECIES: EAL domain-containing protein [unclassified Halomonas]|uniref:bifunctional diguanylate cyclase/phosphodiesterase n=1 Tax=unclassified Halomonas TaxID=2609666 RepID=UPI00288605E2|nr:MULTISPECIES: EAL domain-containing protein [unclassified Halomonas]MDT0499609.1 EAL domain-containing protein [Halomonas sp. PAR7]MDT0510574.1 EAL domain-containing protein [Halomonas sp. LES1]MDT0592627.1 EAL domain-containing protein [Halomonas sp. PAR8]
MSLTKQLWLTIALALLLAFSGSLYIGLSSFRHQIEQEAEIRNRLNAEALALIISQVSMTPDSIGQLLATQFDSGHYRRIELRDTQGNVVALHEGSKPPIEVPSWFVNLANIEAPAGHATVHDPLNRYSTLTFESQPDIAYRPLWLATLKLAGWFGMLCLVGLLLAAWVARSIRRPLRRLVKQAHDIGNRQFITTPEPRLREVRKVVKAMNRLSESLAEILGRESERLDLLRKRLQHDPVSGVLNREAFMKQLHNKLKCSDRQATGTLAMVRLSRLGKVNESLGQADTDMLLHELGQSLAQVGRLVGEGVAGRLNGSDFALLIPSSSDTALVGEEIIQRLTTLEQAQQETTLTLPSALITYAQGDQPSTLLASLDGALANAENSGHLVQLVAKGARRLTLFNSHAEWRQALSQALEDGVYLGRYPVLDAQGQLLHLECPARLRLKGKWRPADIFMPWISRLGFEPLLDLTVARETLRELNRHGMPLGINLSPASLRDGRFMLDFHNLLQGNREAARQLWIEVPEVMLSHDLETLRSLGRELQLFGCRLGVEHVGREFRRITDLEGLGLSYIKIDATLVEGQHESLDQQTLLRGIATLCQSIGIIAIAEGVASLKEAEVIFKLGINGVTGPGIRQLGRPGSQARLVD